jgi:regulatory protein
MATELAEKKSRAMNQLDPQVRKRRLFGLLARKGYGTAIALKVINDLEADDFDGAEIVSDLT